MPLLYASTLCFLLIYPQFYASQSVSSTSVETNKEKKFQNQKAKNKLIKIAVENKIFL